MKVNVFYVIAGNEISKWDHETENTLYTHTHERGNV